MPQMWRCKTGELRMSKLNLIKKYQNWRDERIWQKHYGEPRPDWLVKNPNRSIEATFASADFNNWLVKQTPENQKMWNEKIQIILGELNRLFNAVEDEIIKRGGTPQID